RRDSRLCAPTGSRHKLETSKATDPLPSSSMEIIEHQTILIDLTNRTSVVGYEMLASNSLNYAGTKISMSKVYFSQITADVIF
ncbi:MAG TPA: hypothetical protein VN653_07835, partial [Anaerolineales bacterium]|nr:hypothetical protein [Anaerolineales bacterium]